jgi:hypothetical protein
MKITLFSSAILLCALLSTPSKAQLPYESRARAGDTELKDGNQIVDPGLGNIFFSSSANLGELTINAYKYNLYIGDGLSVPFYLFFSKGVKSEVNKETIFDQIQNDKGGELNFKLANDMWKAPGYLGVCEFKIKKGGCYLSYNVSFKVIEKQGSGSYETQYFPSWYAALGLHLEFPITNETSNLITVAGRLILGIEQAYISADKNDYAETIAYDRSREAPPGVFQERLKYVLDNYESQFFLTRLYATITITDKVFASFQTTIATTESNFRRTNKLFFTITKEFAK